VEPASISVLAERPGANVVLVLVAFAAEAAGLMAAAGAGPNVAPGTSSPTAAASTRVWPLARRAARASCALLIALTGTWASLFSVSDGVGPTGAVGAATAGLGEIALTTGAGVGVAGMNCFQAKNPARPKVTTAASPITVRREPVGAGAATSFSGSSTSFCTTTCGTGNGCDVLVAPGRATTGNGGGALPGAPLDSVSLGACTPGIGTGGVELEVGATTGGENETDGAVGTGSGAMSEVGKMTAAGGVADAIAGAASPFGFNLNRPASGADAAGRSCDSSTGAGAGGGGSGTNSGGAGGIGGSTAAGDAAGEKAAGCNGLGGSALAANGGVSRRGRSRIFGTPGSPESDETLGTSPLGPAWVAAVSMRFSGGAPAGVCPSAGRSRGFSRRAEGGEAGSLFIAHTEFIYRAKRETKKFPSLSPGPISTIRPLFNMTRALLLSVCAVTLALFPGCFFSKKAPRAKESSAISADVEESFRKRWLDKRVGELVAQGTAADTARSKAETEFRDRYGYIRAGQK
jgi:hypothetical protein